MYTRGAPKLHWAVAVSSLVFLLVLKYPQRQVTRGDPPRPQRAEPELHFDDGPLLPDPGGAPSGTAARAATSRTTSVSGSSPQPSAAAEHELHPGRQRWLQLSRLQARLRTGLCADPDAAAEAQDRLRSSFRTLDWGDIARLYVDPHLPSAVDADLLQELDHTEREVGTALGVLPARPDVFAYFDRELLQKSSCADEASSAFYDGALHAVVTQRGMLQRLLRQYARHALVSRGVIGPSWAREGIALAIAGERWWLEPSWLAQIVSKPIELDALEHDLPDTTSESPAQLFYARAAAMVSCATGQRSDGLPGLLAELDVNPMRGELSYRLPPSAEPAQLRSCVAALSH